MNKETPGVVTKEELAELKARCPALSISYGGFDVFAGKCTDDELIEGLLRIREKNLLADVDRVYLALPALPGQARTLSNRALYEIWNTIFHAKSTRPLTLIFIGSIFSWKDVDVKVLQQGIGTDCAVESLVLRAFNHEEFATAVLLISSFAKSLRRLRLDTWDPSFCEATMELLFDQIACLAHLKDIRLPATSMMGQLSTRFVDAVKRSGMRLKALAIHDFAHNVLNNGSWVKHGFSGDSDELDLTPLALLIKDQINIERFVLDACSLKVSDARMLASMLPPGLMELAIGNGRSGIISQEGLCAVVDILRTCPSLWKLHWRCSIFAAAMLEHLATTLLESNHMLENRSIVICQINDPLPVICSALRKTNLRRMSLHGEWRLMCEETSREIVQALKHSLIEYSTGLRNDSVESHFKFVKSKDFKAVFAMCSAKLHPRLGKNSQLRMLPMDVIKRIAITIFPLVPIAATLNVKM